MLCIFKRRWRDIFRLIELFIVKSHFRRKCQLAFCIYTDLAIIRVHGPLRVGMGVGCGKGTTCARTIVCAGNGWKMFMPSCHSAISLRWKVEGGETGACVGVGRLGEERGECRQMYWNLNANLPFRGLTAARARLSLPVCAHSSVCVHVRAFALARWDKKSNP